MRALIERIEEREGTLRAWAAFDADMALAQARAPTRAPCRARCAGVPFAVKDVLNTFDYPTQNGLADL